MVTKKAQSPLLEQGGSLAADAITNHNITKKGDEINHNGASGREEHCAKIGNDGSPPLSITGVEKLKTLEFGLDYLSFTLFAEKHIALEIYAKFFLDKLGELSYQGEGRLYRERYTNGQGFTLQADHKTPSTRRHIRFELPGQSCQLIPLSILKDLYQEAITRGITLKCTRLDIRIDNCPFTPTQIYNAIKEGRANSRAKRDTLKRYEQPLELDDMGNLGTEGIYLGSRTSEKFLRIYNKHGFTRLELETKKDTALLYFNLLQDAGEEFCNLAMGLIMDFITVDADFWKEFTDGYERAYMKTTEYRDLSLEGLESSVEQWGQAIAILIEIKGLDWFLRAIESQKKAALENPKYISLLHRYGLYPENYTIRGERLY
jgi:hypothetical protein